MNTVLFRRQSINSGLRLAHAFLRYSSQDVVIYDDPSKYKEVMKPSRVKNRKTFKKNPIERLFLGELDCSLLEYPEVSAQSEVDYLHDFVSIIEKNLDIINQSDQDESIKLTNYESLRTLQLFGLKTPKEFCGYEFTEPECAYIYESLAFNPSLLKVVSENEEFGLQILTLYGSEEQKKKYMPKLVTGEMVVCFAHFESFPILNKDPLKTIAYTTSKGENFTIVGKKTLVYNANIADLIIVSANTSNEENGNKQSFFLIEKNFGGVRISEPADVIGLNNAGFSEMTLDKVVVPQECILGKLDKGEKLFKNILSLGKMNIGMQCGGQMKSLCNNAIHHNIFSHLFKKPLNEHHFMQRELGKLICETYAVESMAYLVSGRLYEFENPDLFLESLIVKVYASEALQRGLESYLQLMNRNSYKGKYHLNEMLRVSAFHSVFDENNDNLKLLIASTGMEYAKGKRVHRIRKLAQLFKYKFNKQVMENTRGKGFDQDTMTWYVHPTLHEFIRQVYEWLLKFDKIVEKFMKEYESGDSSNMQYKFLKLADMIITIYAMTAIMGRASRSYCIGLRNADLEIKIAMNMCSVFNRQFENFELDLLKYDGVQEKRIKSIGNKILESGKYQLSHPYLRQQKVSAKG